MWGVFLIFLCIFSNYCAAEDKTKDPYPQIEIPIYTTAKDIKHFIDINLKLKSITYIVKCPYPAVEIDFYVRKFKELGFKEFLDSTMMNYW